MKRVVVTVIAAVTLMVFTSGLAWGKEPATPELTLNQAIELAVRHSKALKRAELEVDRTAELRTYRYEQLDYVPYAIPNDPRVEVAWANMLAADLTWQMARKSLGLEEDRLVLDVCQKYWDVLRAQDKVDAAEAALRKAEWDLRKARASAQVGLATSLTLSRAEAGLAGAQAALEAAENDLAAAYVKLNDLLGLWPQDRPVLVDTVVFHPLEVYDLDTAVQRVVDESPAVWLAQERATMQKYLENLMFYTGDYRPYQARKIEVRQAELEAASAKEMARLLTRNLYHRVRNLEEAYQPLAQAVEIAKEDLRVARIKHALGMITAAEVAAAEAALADAEQRAMAYLYDHAYLKLAFEKPWAMGSGSMGAR